MPTPLPPIDKRFKKGQSGNPNGRPKVIPDDLRNAKKIGSEEFKKEVNKFLRMDRASLQEVLQNPRASMLELLVGGIVAKAAKEQDHLRANFLLDRLIGKVKENMEINMPRPMTINRLDGTQLILSAEVIETNPIALPAEKNENDPTL